MALLTWREPVSPVRLRIVAGGDFCPGPLGSALAHGGRANEVLVQLAPFLADADLRIVQFETPLATEPSPILKSGPNLLSAPESADVLRGYFDVALLANNHIGDQGPDAVLATIRELRARGLATVGAGTNLAAAAAPLEIERRGIRVAVFNFAEHEFGIAGTNAPGAVPQRPREDLAAVMRAAANGALPVVVLHGGHEHFPFPSPRLRDLCRDFAEAGAKLVVNCHEHCPQGIEWHVGVPIIYCPGNFWFPPRGDATSANRPPLWYYGYLVKVLFDTKGAFAIELLPHESGANFVRPLEGAARAAFLDYIARVSEPLSDPVRLQALFEAWCADKGRAYLRFSAAALPTDWLKDEAPRDWERGAADPRPFVDMRNVFTCESHNDLVRTYLELCVSGRLADASRLQPEIDALRNPAFALSRINQP